MSSFETFKEIPSELKENLSNLDQSLSQLGENFGPLLSTQQSDLQTKLNPLEQAKIDLAVVYSVNSLFWAYLNTCGVNPKGKGVKTELDRIRTYMNRVKEIEDKKKAPKLNSDAAMRFVRNSLWEAAHKKSQMAKDRNQKDDQRADRDDGDEGGAVEEGNDKKKERKHDDNETDDDDDDVPSKQKIAKFSHDKKNKKKNKKKHSKSKGKFHKN